MKDFTDALLKRGPYNFERYITREQLVNMAARLEVDEGKLAAELAAVEIYVGA